MKRRIALFMAMLMLAMTLFACGEEAKEPQSTETGSEAATTEAAPVVTDPPVTEPMVTEPLMITVYEPVFKDDFDSADNSLWRANAQMTNFRIEGGYMYTTSTGGDPSIVSKTNFAVPCEDIDCVRIRFKNMTANSNIQMFFTTDETTSFCEEASYRDILDYESSAADSDEWNEITFWTEGNALWTSNLRNIRIDLSNGEGDFQVDWISLDKTHEEVAG